MLEIYEINNPASTVSWVNIDTMEKLKSYLSDLNGFPS
jgi:hypothetical protein